MRLLARLGWPALFCALLWGPAANAGETNGTGGAPHASPKKSPKAAPAKKPGPKKRASPKKSQKPGTKSRRSSRPPEFPADAGTSRASSAAGMDRAACRREFEKRGIRVTELEKLPGVELPVRLVGPVGGVVFKSDYPDAQRPTLPFEVFDCRLVVALAHFATILREHDVSEVRIFSAYRPPPKATPAAAVRTGHPGGLAVDLRLFIKSSGARLEVLTDFQGQIGADPCGSGAPGGAEKSPTRELRSIFCAGVRERLFHLMLSPNYDRPHRNHFHFEVRPDVRWFIVR